MPVAVVPVARTLFTITGKIEPACTLENKIDVDSGVSKVISPVFPTYNALATVARSLLLEGATANASNAVIIPVGGENGTAGVLII